MKKYIIGFIALVLSVSSGFASEALEEGSKTLKKTFLSIEKQAVLAVSNIYGNIDIAVWEKNSISCEVRVTARSRTREHVRELLKGVDVEFSSSNKQCNIETRVSVAGGRDNGNQLEIQMQIFVPAHVLLQLKNKYGDINLSNTGQTFNCEIDYGALRAGDLTGLNNRVVSRYGAVQIGQSTDLTVHLNYSALSATEINRLSLVSGYSAVRVQKVYDLDAHIKYGAFLVGWLKSGQIDASYSEVNIDAVMQQLGLIIRYGATKLNVADQNFTAINIDASYTDVTLAVPKEASFQTDLSTSHATISVSGALDHSRLKVEKEGSSKSVSGPIGREENPTRKITVSNRYNKITLQ